MTQMVSPIPSYAFVSYASVDLERVGPIVDALEAAGVAVWIDREAIPGGTSYGPEIVSGIEGCAVLLVMCSTASLTSHNVRQEVSLAWKYRRPCLPLLLDQVLIPRELEYWLEGAQWVEILEHPVETWLPRVLRALERNGLHHLGRSISQPIPVDGVVSGRMPTTQQHNVTNLPPATTSFIGRASELARIDELLAFNRCVTVTGAGGSGKTRVAIEAGLDHLGRYMDGVWFVELATISEPERVLTEVARVVGIHDQSDQPLAAAFFASLASQHLLLILDNCEHVINACADLTRRLIASAPAVSILATSREPLAIPGEIVYRIPPLSLPVEADEPSLADLAQSEAVQLFVARAAQARSGFALTEANGTDVAMICRRLDGIPLALELAAARVRVLTVEQISNRLTDRFRLLTGGSRVSLPRQQTLRATIDWSYDLLDDDERVLLQRLSVFVGGCTIDTAEVVCADDGLDSADILDLISHLVDKSLVTARDSSDTMRYDLLETIRQYSSEKLQESGQTDSLARRHAEHIANLVLSLSPLLHGHQQHRALAEIDIEYEDARAALAWTIEHDQERAVELAAALRWYWTIRGRLSEGRQWLRLALSPPCTAGDACITAYNGLAMLAIEQGDLAEAGQCLSHAHAAITSETQIRAIIETEKNDGHLAYHEGAYERAMPALQSAYQLASTHEDRWSAAAAGMNLGAVSGTIGDLHNAARMIEASLVAFRALGDDYHTAICIENLANVAELNGELDTAFNLLQECLTLYERVGDRIGMIDALQSLAGFLIEHHPEQAARLLGAAEREQEKMGIMVASFNQEAYDERSRQLRAALPEDQLASYLSEGRTLPLHLAVAEIRDTAPRPSSHV